MLLVGTTTKVSDGDRIVESVVVGVVVVWSRVDV